MPNVDVFSHFSFKIIWQNFVKMDACLDYDAYIVQKWTHICDWWCQTFTFIISRLFADCEDQLWCPKPKGCVHYLLIKFFNDHSWYAMSMGYCFCIHSSRSDVSVLGLSFRTIYWTYMYLARFSSSNQIFNPHKRITCINVAYYASGSPHGVSCHGWTTIGIWIWYSDEEFCNYFLTFINVDISSAKSILISINVHCHIVNTLHWDWPIWLLTSWYIRTCSD